MLGSPSGSIKRSPVIGPPLVRCPLNMGRVWASSINSHLKSIWGHIRLMWPIRECGCWCYCHGHPEQKAILQDEDIIKQQEFDALAIAFYDDPQKGIRKAVKKYLKDMGVKNPKELIN